MTKHTNFTHLVIEIHLPPVAVFLQHSFVHLSGCRESNITCSVQVIDISVRKLQKYLMNLFVSHHALTNYSQKKLHAFAFSFLICMTKHTNFTHSVIEIHLTPLAVFLRHSFVHLSGCRESNPGHTVPNRVHYHYATPRCSESHVVLLPKSMYGQKGSLLTFW